MFCTNCGKQIPEGAMFCPNCGSMAAPKQPTQQGAEQPQYHTAPYTVPVDASPEVKAQAQQYPSYTLPLDPAAAQQYPQYTAPVDQPQQYPQYTAPVESSAQPYQHTVPVDTPPMYADPIPEAPNFVPPAYEPQKASTDTPPVSPVQQPDTSKGIRKLLIILGVVAAVVVIAVTMLPLRIANKLLSVCCLAAPIVGAVMLMRMKNRKLAKRLAIAAVLVLALILIFDYLIRGLPYESWHWLLTARQYRSLQRWVISTRRLLFGSLFG